EGQLLCDWNSTEREFYQGCFHQWFERQAATTPNRIAARNEQQVLSYAELNARANQLANYLSKRGVAPGVLTGIFVERSLEMLIGLLGILKAGGAYVPLDPAYPTERLAFMLADSRVPVLLTQQSLWRRLPHYTGRIVGLDKDAEAIRRHGGEDQPAF